MLLREEIWNCQKMAIETNQMFLSLDFGERVLNPNFPTMIIVSVDDIDFECLFELVFEMESK